jgi:hypothetical protein
LLNKKPEYVWFADGPDAVHRGVVARIELAKYKGAAH